MPGTPYEITALPVVVPLAAVALAAMLWRLHRHAALDVPRVAVSVAVCVYGAGVVANTLLPIYIGKDPNPLPWWVHLNLIPLVNTEPADMLKNVVVFVPLGVLLPLVTRVRSAGGVLLGGFLISLTMELLQFINSVTGQGGHIADVNDLLANTVGAAIGYGLYRVALLLPVVGPLVGAAVWPAPSHDEPRDPAARVKT